MSIHEFLIELGVEEIPARMMDDALTNLSSTVEDWVERSRLSGDDVWIESYGTPRRLVVHGCLPEIQPDQLVTEKGPPEHIAFDNDGSPTQALKGFCAQYDVDPSTVEVQELDGGKYTVLERTEEGIPTPQLLENDAGQWFLQGNWPKSMRWEESGIQFVRPIRWALGFFGEQALDFNVGPVSSASETRGLRFTENQRISVSSIEDYFTSLQDSNIVLDPEARAEKIKEEAQKLAKEKGGTLFLPDFLLEELNYLVESPTPFLGRFDSSFLELPRPVLEEAMISHQKYIPVRSDNELLPVFVGVRNGTSRYIDSVREGNEKVIRARLNDAVFFYEKDLKRHYESFRQELKGVVFQEKLGSLHDKTERLAELIGHVEDLPSSVKTIARHLKNDHVTEIVGEFPNLQGIMGTIYAEESGWSSHDAKVIKEHYLPRGREDDLPESCSGQWLGILDRLDTLIGFFALGERVTGSSDPYGLRRDALGVLRISLFGDIELDISEWIQRSVDAYRRTDLEFDDSDQADLVEFLKDRLYYLLRDLTGGRDDEGLAVLSRFWNRPKQAKSRVEWLIDWRDRDEFEDLYTTAQRVGNIVRDRETSKPEPQDFQKDSSRILWEQYQQYHTEVIKAISAGDAGEILELLASFRPHVDQFFEDVMVMTEDKALRENRLSLLSTIRDLFDQVADFTRLEQER